MNVTNRIRCDAEIGKPGNWSICNRTAKHAVMRALGGEMHYCERHKNHCIGMPSRTASGIPTVWSARPMLFASTSTAS